MKTLIIFISLLIPGASFWRITPPSDYRDTYCGTYACKKIRWYLNSDNNSMLRDTVSVNVTISKNDTDSIVNIITGEGTLLLKLTSTNKLYAVNRGDRYYGRVTTDSLIFNLSFSKTPPFYKYYGKK